MTESRCDRELVRDYVFDEIPAAARAGVANHIAACPQCAAELARLQLTMAALRALPDREVPQRIAFVSDKVFEPSPVRRFFSAFWNSGPRLGFASACILSAAFVIFAFHRPAEIRNNTQTALPADFSRQVDAAVARQVNARIDKAVSDAVARVHAEDARLLQAALESADRKAEQRRRALMVAMGEELNTLQKRLGVYTEYAMSTPERVPAAGATQ